MRRGRRLRLGCFALVLCAALTVQAAESACCPDCVIVALDLDPLTPGFQTRIEVASGTRTVAGVAVWVFDPAGAAPLHSIGFVGGLNRGLALGHEPDASTSRGRVTALTATQVQPLRPDNLAFVNSGIEPLFSGPELQYFEVAEPGAAPAAIPAQPAAPVMRVDVELADASPGDVLRLYLADRTAHWISGQGGASGGAFSSNDLNTLESGGDACPDGTRSAAGTDPDPPAPVPPARFRVDYVDGGGAEIRVLAGVPALPRGIAALLLALLATVLLAARRARPSSA